MHELMESHRIVDLSRIEDKSLTLKQVMNMKEVKAVPASKVQDGNAKLSEEQVTQIARNLFDSIDKEGLGEVTKQQL